MGGSVVGDMVVIDVVTLRMVIKVLMATPGYSCCIITTCTTTHSMHCSFVHLLLCCIDTLNIYIPLITTSIYIFLTWRVNWTLYSLDA